MLYMGYLIILDGKDMKKNPPTNGHLWGRSLPLLPTAMHPSLAVILTKALFLMRPHPAPMFPFPRKD